MAKMRKFCVISSKFKLNSVLQFYMLCFTTTYYETSKTCKNIPNNIFISLHLRYNEAT